MSRGQLPREPRFFPRMKSRGLKRHWRREWIVAVHPHHPNWIVYVGPECWAPPGAIVVGQ